MASKVQSQKWTTKVQFLGPRRARRCFAGGAVAVASLLGTALPALAAVPPTLAVVVAGSGAVVSKPAGIACPGTCTATFAAGTSVLLTPQARGSSVFVRWGGACTGTGKCIVKVSSLVAVAAQFVRGAKSGQPAPTKPVAVPGSYTSPGAGGVYTRFSFFVSPSGTSLLNVSVFVEVFVLGCTPIAGSFPSGPDDASQQIVIPTVAIGRDGSFAATVTRSGLFDNAPAKFTDSFAGRFQGATSAGPPMATGTLRKDMVFPANGTTETCTSNEQTWTATHDSDPVPTNSVAVPGSYTSSGSTRVTFSVSGTSLLNVAVPSLGGIIGCTDPTYPNGIGIGVTPPITIPTVAIGRNGSFAATETQSGVLNGAPAKFTYSFAGNFEGATPAGPETVAGTVREDIVYPAHGTTETCTSNEQTWTAARN